MNFLGEIFKYENHARVCGLTSELQAQYYYHYFKQNDDNILIVTNSLYDSNKIYQKLKTYTDDVCLFPMDDFLSSVALAISPDLKVNRLETLEYLKNHDKTIVVTNLMGYLRFLPSYEKSQNLKVSLKKGLTIDRDKIVNELEEYGYVRTSLVTSTGEFALRGFIIDIFRIEADHPIRIELFGEEVEAIRVFNEETQLSINEISKIDILPIQELNFDEHSSLFEYMHNPFVFFINENQINNGYNKIRKDIEEYSGNKDVLISDFMYSFEEINPNNYMYIETINNFDNSISFNSKEIIKFKGDYDTFKDFCLTHKNTNVVIICLSKDKQIDLVKELFSDVNIGSIKENTINILKFKLNEGFIIDKYMVISEFDIDNFKITNVYKNNFKIGRKIKGFEDIKIGDYVVHSQHGIGVYAGIEAITKNGLVKDYIKINYLGNDKIYIPVEKITTIYKYSDKDGTPPKLNKLNSTSWAKTKMKVRNRIKDISDELIKLYATRTSIKGPVFNNFDEEYTFAANFNYNETNDQLKTIKEIDNDLKSSIPMDRILCGDVGFGKTEVAFRGMFKTIVNGYQVAYLCPTTLLSRQQYNNALSRFREFPVNIALLNRFTSTKEVKRIYEGLKSGSIDIVFGTHKLLNKEIEFNNLGLLVVDEEQRFGVTHKERIKEIKNDVNVLTLSATPIPRTLKMAMSGLRDLSIIDTAPINRYPVQTYVVEEKEVLIKDAVYKELSRNGQVFVLYNRVASIQDEVDKLSSLVPEARIVMAHGQMDKNELENIVSDFVDYKYDILVCTTIIETGIDIPNVNTLIVIDADNFGLSQLYQLRGRVGRSDKIAYAYLMYNPAKVLTETAIKRLQSIKDFTELGSGYKIAMRDLSIRGAGDLLGAEQAGFVDSVGLELYTQMVSEEIKRLNGEEVLEEENSNPLIEVANHISDEFVKEESIKIEIHQLINEIKDQTSLEKVKSEILDRFGNITSEMDIYMHEEWFSELANQLNIKRVKQTETLLELELPADISDKIQGDKLFLIAYNINPKFRLSYRMRKIYVSLSLVNLEKHFVYSLVPLLDEIKNMIA